MLGDVFDYQGSLARPREAAGAVCLTTKACKYCKNSWKSMKLIENQWESRIFMWKSMGIHENP